MQNLRLLRILVFAPDLEEAKRFYSDVLELRLDSAHGDLLRFHGANFVLDVFACQEHSEFGAYAQQAGSSVAFSVPSLDDAMRELKGHGVHFLHEKPNQAPDGSRYAAFVDPFGTVFEIVEGDGNCGA